MFDSFMIRQIRINDARHDYSVFLARLSPAISETCSKIKHHWSKFEARRRNNEVGISLTGSSCFGDRRNNSLHKRLWFNNKRSDHLRLVLADGDLARMLITEIAKVSASKKAPAAGESGNQRPKRRKDKLIRFNDLIPKQDVKGGQRLLFGVTDKTQSTNNPTKDK